MTKAKFRESGINVLLRNVTWMDQAACKDTTPAEAKAMFFSFDEKGPAICQTCPVQPECLDYALTNHIDHGTWGGKSEKERARMTGRFNGSRARVRKSPTTKEGT